VYAFAQEEQIRRPSIDKSGRNCRSHNVIPTSKQKIAEVQVAQWSVWNSHGHFQEPACQIAETASGLGD
jgi:hypothetical protein